MSRTAQERATNVSDDPADGEPEYVIVTEYFHPDTASTGQLMTDLAVGLQERGLDVTVYTGQPNYHSGDNERQPRITRHEEVLVKRIRAPQVRQSSLPRRLFNWTVFTLWMAAALLVSRPDREREFLFVSNPPLLPVAMWAVCRLRNWEYTYVVYDLYPDQPVELGYLTRGGVVERLWRTLNNAAFRGAEHVVALGPAMRDRISESVGDGFDTGKVAIIHNWADGEFIQPRPKTGNWFCEEHDLVEPFTVLYSGNVGEFHDLDTVVEAAAAFEDAREEVTFLIIGDGDGKDDVVALAEELGVRGSTVEFLPFQPREDIPYSLPACDVSVVTVEEGFEGVCVSSKLYTTLATGRPALGITQPDDDEARIIDAFDAGTHVPQGDVEGLVEAIETWMEDPDHRREQGSNAREAFEQHFTEHSSIDAYYALLTEGEAPSDPLERTSA